MELRYGFSCTSQNVQAKKMKFFIRMLIAYGLQPVLKNLRQNNRKKEVDFEKFFGFLKFIK